MPTMESVLDDALALSDDDRERLLERLNMSFDWTPEVAAAWRDEIRRRLESIENGTATFVTLEEVVAQSQASVA